MPALIPPEPHIPSRYRRPSVPPVWAQAVTTDDGARIAAFVYAPDGQDAPAALAAQLPVLFLHGNGEEHGIFGPSIDAVLASGRAAIALDSRAQGVSTRGSARLSYELMAQDAWDVLAALQVERAHVVGFSDGAIEALIMARDQPGRVASLLSIGANLTPEGVVDDGWDLAGAVAVHEAWAQGWETASGAVDPALLTPAPQEAARTAELLQLMLDEPHIPAESLSAISCPTCVMVGEHDCIAPEQTAQIAQAIPGARLVVVPEQGHVLPKHAPAEVSCQLLVNILRAERA